MRIVPSVRTAYVLVLATLALGGLAMRGAMSALDVYLKKEPVALRADFGSIPATLGRWKKYGEDQQMDAAMVESLGTDKYLTRSYALDGDPAKGMMLLHLAYYTGMIDTVPHIPERCWGAGGLVQLGEPVILPLAIAMLGEMRPDAAINVASGKPYPMASVVDPVTQASEDVALPVGDFAMTLSTFQDPKAPRLEQLGGYLFVANGRCTPSTLAVRTLAFDLSDRFAYFCKLQLSSRYAVGERPSASLFKEQAEDFLTQLLPHLMRRLPDWPSVERGAVARG